MPTDQNAASSRVSFAADDLTREEILTIDVCVPLEGWFDPDGPYALYHGLYPDGRVAPPWRHSLASERLREVFDSVEVLNPQFNNTCTMEVFVLNAAGLEFAKREDLEVRAALLRSE